jgi:cell division protein FtsL
MSVDLFLINKNYVEYEKPFLLSQLILLAFILSILMIFLFSAAARQQRLSANSEIHRISEQFDDLKNQIDTLSMSNNVS